MRKFMMAAAAIALAGCGADQTIEELQNAKEPGVTITRDQLDPSRPALQLYTHYTNATIYTGRADETEDSILVDPDGNILGFGDIKDVLKSIDGTDKDGPQPIVQSTDLEGAFVYPGLVDGHVHLLGIGQRAHVQSGRHCLDWRTRHASGI